MAGMKNKLVTNEMPNSECLNVNDVQGDRNIK